MTQPLTTALGAAHTLSHWDHELDDGDRRLALDILVRNLEHLKLLIAGLGVFAQMGNGLQLNISKASLGELCAGASQDFTNNYPSKTLDLRCQEARIEMDVVLIKQVLSNLLHNAHKYSPAGTTIRLQARPIEGGTEIEVANEGIGFAQIDAERIFDKSVQLDAAKAGVGMGLYVVRAIVEAHGGTVSATSVPGKGACFRVMLPKVLRLHPQ